MLIRSHFGQWKCHPLADKKYSGFRQWLRDAMMIFSRLCFTLLCFLKERRNKNSCYIMRKGKTFLFFPSRAIKRGGKRKKGEDLRRSRLGRTNTGHLASQWADIAHQEPTEPNFFPRCDADADPSKRRLQKLLVHCLFPKNERTKGKMIMSESSSFWAKNSCRGKKGSPIPFFASVVMGTFFSFLLLWYYFFSLRYNYPIIKKPVACRKL